MQILMFILVVGAAQGVFLSVLLLGRKVNTMANRVLATSMIAMAIFLMEAVYYGAEWFRETTAFIGVSEPLIFVFGPILYLYTLIVMRGGQEFKRGYLLHFIPALLVLLYDSQVYFASHAFKLEFIEQMMAGNFPLDQRIIGYAKHIHGCVYAVLTAVLLYRHARDIRDTHSSIERINLRWLRHMTIGLVLIWAFALFNFVMYEMGIALTNTPISLTPFAVAVFIYAIGYLGLRQPEIFHAEALTDSTAVEPSSPAADEPAKPRTSNSASLNIAAQETQITAAYRKSGLDEARAQSLQQQLEDYMRNEEPWRNANLTLNELAQALDATAHNLTEVINTRFGKNFYDFVNAYRVAEVRRQLQEPATQHLTILALAYDAGFNAKSTFNTIFKKHVGKTPSQVRREASVEAVGGAER